MDTRTPIITLKDVVIKYKNTKPVGYRTFLKKFLKREKTNINSKDEFTAVNEVSFKMYKGETIGIVGANGSGKSTLLRAIAGIYGIDGGILRINCERLSLLALGVGFQSRLSGRTNIYLSGYAMGFSKQEIEEKIDEIIEFSELGDFINKPVKTYSSGMYSKLAFSISAILSTDVMLIDEVLSVGDIRFQKKSAEKIISMINDSERSVIIVSQSVSKLKEICNKVLWLNNSRQMMFGDATEVLDEYNKFMSGGKK